MEERNRLGTDFGELELSVTVSLFIGAGPMGCSFTSVTQRPKEIFGSSPDKFQGLG